MNKIIKLHGCSGAGKTTVARAIMRCADVIEEVVRESGKNNKLKTEANVCKLPMLKTAVAVLGSYDTPCGGMDTYPSDAPSITKLIDDYYKLGVHVFFEGLLLSTYYGAVGRHLEQYGDNTIHAFMDTPIDVCLDRIKQRRLIMKSTNKFDPMMTREKHFTIENLMLKCKMRGLRVVEIKYDEDPVKQIAYLLGDVN